MTDDIVTRMRVKASRCTHGNERYYNGPEGIDAYLIDTCSWCYSWNEAADEIERLQGEVEGWREAVDFCHSIIDMLRKKLAEHRLPGDGGDDTISDQTS